MVENILENCHTLFNRLWLSIVGRGGVDSHPSPINLTDQLSPGSNRSWPLTYGTAPRITACLNPWTNTKATKEYWYTVSNTDTWLPERVSATGACQCNRKDEYSLDFNNLWDNPSFIASRLPKEVMLILLVHPNNARQIYLSHMLLHAIQS